MRIRWFLKNDAAVEGLPMRLLTTVILFSVILGLSAAAVYDFIDDAKEKKLMSELDLIEKRAAVMYIQGGARDIGNPEDFGSIENIRVKIPDNAAFVVFGAMPAPDGKPPETRDMHADNVYYYVLNNGRAQARSSVARFSANDTDLNRPVVLYPGEHDLTLELVRNKNDIYVRIE